MNSEGMKCLEFFLNGAVHWKKTPIVLQKLLLTEAYVKTLTLYNKELEFLVR